MTLPGHPNTVMPSLGLGIHELGTRKRPVPPLFVTQVATEVVDVRAKPWHDEGVCYGHFRWNDEQA